MPYYIERTRDDFLKITKPEEIRLPRSRRSAGGHHAHLRFDLLSLIYAGGGLRPSEIRALILRHNLYGLRDLFAPRAAQLRRAGACVQGAGIVAALSSQSEQLVRRKIIELQTCSLKGRANDYIEALGFSRLSIKTCSSCSGNLRAERIRLADSALHGYERKSRPLLRDAIEAKGTSAAALLREDDLKVLPRARTSRRRSPQRVSRRRGP